MIGEAMGQKRKPGMLIATKARFPMGEGPNDRGLSRWHLIRACEASLKRLGPTSSTSIRCISGTA